MKDENKIYLDALAETETPSFVLRSVKIFVSLFFVFPILMLFLPWQQNVTALGKVTAFSPSERVQTIDAPVSGLISKWYVQEGSIVKEGDTLLEISDIDPMFKDRLEAQRNNLQVKLNAKQEELKSYQVQQQNLIISRDAKISAAQFKLDVANQKILSTTEAISSAKATADAAEFQSNRMQRLFVDGLVSKRDLEVAERDLIIANRNLVSSQAQHNSAKAEAQSAKAEIQEIRADTQASLDSSAAVINKIKGELADSQNSLTGSEINLSRQNMQRITAPRAGTIFRLPVNSQSQMISQGQPLLVILPDTKARAVELWVDGRDAPLMTENSLVRLEFEGWPAIQVPGWAKVGIGTFSGKVSFIDPTDNGTGNFRVMVVPDAQYPDWPSARFLRQGVSAKGWILLENVTIGYEIWRLLNGFPARIPELQSYPNEKILNDKK
ncbi:MAG: HlyD family efflux transporter periplasmic adaptor subunit [Methylotenera sp.]|nr:HlyD family efflux transporter periplasmic adaptor subunit [Methylotenera sp.]MDO9231965.1 HlyD family efflux transporter periplasmic adaptor subunit [Methylotenera sp.]MDO9388482.1 HlyD family efflux transporter periplasmic adaptor subunit [Methylotenera sp.]MDP2102379.1 HlyD family efflux transporter periplasmic adaptor subunit [Methylotenera sp.]MDP2281019.1 HlyD family efflux transporter periplasmic adaptor subunit [Methylotenera sp.]